MKPPLELSVILRGGTGREWRLSPDSPQGADRPVDISFSTEAGEGFATGQIVLKRGYDQDTPDLSLLNEVIVQGADGQIAYEGRIQGVPRSLQAGGPEIRLDCQGWMSHARARPFTDLIVDRDLTQWVDMTIGRQAELSADARYPIYGPEGGDDPGAVWVRIPRLAQSGTKGAIAGTSYRSPVPIGQLRVYSWAYNGAPWTYSYALSSNAKFTTDFVGGDGSPPGTNEVTVVGTGVQVWAEVHFRYEGAFTGDGNWPYAFQPLVIGRHGLPMAGTDTGNYVFSLTDVIRYLAGRYAPMLDLSRIQDNSFPIRHAVWRDPVTAHDAIKELNAYTQWALGVFENRQLEFRPFNLSTYDWQVRAGQDGVEIETQGVTTEGSFNGVVVSFTDFSGAQRTLTPDDNADLRDTNPAIPANQWGEQAWLHLAISTPQVDSGAITIASMYLAEMNRPRFPSTITVPGHIKDSTGAWQPAWRVRANQTISVRNHPNDAPRLITSTSWQGNRLQITCDNALNRFEAITARLDRARADKGM